MTTIAWDGKTLAADSQATTDGLRYPATKLFRTTNGGLFGGAGVVSQIMCALAWLNGEESNPGDWDGGFGIYINKAGKAFKVEGTPFVLVPHPKQTATGSGRDYAMAAMACGKTAAEAVAVAKKFDIYSGGPVKTLTLK